MDPKKLREELDAKSAEIRSLAEKETLSEEEETRLTTLTGEFKPLEERTVAAETRAREIERITTQPRHIDRGTDVPGQINRTDPFAEDVDRMTRVQKRDAAKRVLESRSSRLHPRSADHVEQLLEKGRVGDEIAERMLLTENPAYRAAFAKKVTRGHMAMLTAEENDAMARFQEWESRAMSEGTTTAGGYGVPVLIDPSVIITSGAANAPILAVADVINVNTNVWKGVTSAGVSWSYDAEASAVSDDSPTLGQPSITVYMARGFVPFSIELEMDYPSFESELMKVLTQGYIDKLAAGTANGDGSSKPRGVIAAMAAQTSPAQVKLTTQGTLGAVDIRAAWAALPERFRGNARWLMSVSVENQIRALGNNNALADYTVNLAADGTSVLCGRPVILTDYAPAFSSVTTSYNYLVVGDFQNFKIIQRAGMSVEPIQHLFDVTTARPTGSRGLFAYSRHGHDVASVNAFRVLSNHTTP